jgi:tRNA A-37 threonylcarbamoyl transferase component Bud32
MSQADAAAGASVSEAFGRYRIGRQLAVGGMGVIFVAHDTLARREVAYKRLKVSSESSRPRMTALFEREYNALRQLKHPNIVEVYDYGLDAEGPYYTMELLTGKDLAAAAPLPLVEACRVLRDVASALALVHARRLVHRDVTPANVRLTHDGRAKLLDFGALSEFGVSQEIVGTPPFVAPECLSGEALDARTDLFALGGLAYWALLRRHAYPARTIGELIDTWSIPVAPPSEQVRELPREIDELVLSLLERDPVARPASCAHVIERLTAVAQLAPEPDAAQVAYSYLLHPPLVGRGPALKQLRRFATEAAQGRGRAVMIDAASGLGRSALLDQVAVDAQLSGANVLRFSPSGKRDAGLANSIVRWMRALLPELWSAQHAKNPVLAHETRMTLHAAQSPGEITEQRARLVAAIEECVGEMSALAPLTLLIDDVHRADAESLAVLASLARRSSSARLLLVLSKEERARGTDASALSKLHEMATRLTLAPLAEPDLGALVPMVFGDVPNSQRLARFLHAQSGGNPGQCMDLCRLLLQEREIRYAQGTFVLPFDPHAELVGARTLELTRLADLSEHALALVRLLAVPESTLSLAQAGHALGRTPAELVAAAAELAARGLVRLHESDVGVASESLRAALRASLSPDQSRTLHLLLGKCLMETGDGAIETKLSACHHLLCAGEADAALALVWHDLVRSRIPLGATAACVPVLEQLLEAQRARGLSDERCWPVLVPLVIAGFWGELSSVKRHRDAALDALANLTGFGLARRLTPRLGKKLALIVGMSWGLLRFIGTPKRLRAPSYSGLVQRFFAIVTMSTATASSAFEPETALQIAAFLDPIEAMKADSAGRIAREFAQATAEVGSGQNARAAQRYARIMAELDKRAIFDPLTQDGFYDGCTHGRAQAEVTLGAPGALEMADALARRHPFFGPHVESIRMTYHGYRGEKELAEQHRKQGEALALQGGLSWSAFTLLAIRSAYISMVSQDTLGVLQASVELERISAIAPNALLYRDMCKAYVCLVRGQHQAALDIHQRIAALPHAHLMPAWELDGVYHAQALLGLDKLQEAEDLCLEVMRVRKAQGVSLYPLRLVQQQLALIEAKRGDFARAKWLLEEVALAVKPSEGPLQVGSVCRDQARVALLERDAAAFDTHFAAMLEAFRRTKNPVLIQQCRRLLAEAEKSGLVATVIWEKHELTAPANTQDLASQPPPEMTELVDTQT